ncbi:fumarylacetoacetate hydrolase family protein [Bacillus subtilis]|uniref:fumarylacetoacetate hydrolase family protein n=1 Tax=Pseudochrobactrum asaccharolyticum TaxID=354351 RepID=UPI001F2665E2|nr:fumarylacetoacetate hydrolase family protein [Pseudochrobactrum asaccharolyticum]MCF7644437.1 fumarylacetoacetate hydrolase family protein [Pseudochrobactrum asaccharolyticum]MCF7670324.1 fumarylacetoacetate hydrolase family protein [Bacillus subtilis]
MSDKLIFPEHPPVTLPIEGSDQRFPVRRIYCVGRNYADHAREMGHDPDREPPFFFQKNPDNLVTDGGNFPYPPLSNDVHHEIELVVALHKGGKNIPAAEANDYIYGYAVGLDMTRRDMQGVAKKQGRPWETAKAFEQSAPCSALVPAARIGHPSAGSIWLKINGKTVQEGDINQLIWSIPETIAVLSTLYELQAGDVIFTGTPAGVGPVARGDVIEGGVDAIGHLTTKVV